MEITALIENTSCSEGVGAEHGLSLYIKANGKKLLFDMGQTDLFTANAQVLGADLSAVDFAVLSHGHYDHGGGLKRFLEINKTAPVYLSRYAFGDYYNGTEKYIGLDKTLQNSERLIFVGDEMKICDGFTLYSCNDKPRERDLGSFGLNKKADDEFAADDFLHEQYLLIEEGGKRVLISGCSHKGVMDIVSWFEPDVFVGGFHYSSLARDEKLKGYSEYLAAFNTDYYTCHCTGVDQFDYMSGYMPRLKYLSCGQTVSI
ncbi:MAG: MBL fold metallo-hydrolase [Clostridia bacterium]|nr:MBL fold metallo-hydrolase [Clostridia bacterium]